MSNTELNEHKKRTVLTKTFKGDESKLIQTYNMRSKVADIAADEPVYIYASQRNNFYEKQMR